MPEARRRCDEHLAQLNTKVPARVQTCDDSILVVSQHPETVERILVCDHHLLKLDVAALIMQIPINLIALLN